MGRDQCNQLPVEQGADTVSLLPNSSNLASDGHGTWTENHQTFRAHRGCRVGPLYLSPLLSLAVNNRPEFMTLYHLLLDFSPSALPS